VEKVLKMALSKAEEGEVYKESFQSTIVNFQFNHLKSVDSCFGQGVGLRVIKNGKIGFSSVTTNKDLELLVSSAIASASFGQKARFKFPSPSKVPQVECFDSNLPSVPVERMIEEGENTIKIITKEFPSVQCEAELEKEIATISILNSSGLNLTYKKSFYSFSIYAFLAEEGDFLGVAEEECGCQYKDYSTLLAQRVIEKIKLAQKKADIQTGIYPAIFTSKAMPLIFNSLEKGINGKLVQKNSSPLCSKLNQPIFSTLLTIVDDATLNFGPSSSPIDDEGVPSRQNTIVERGILKTFIYDLQTAGLMKTETTANGRRDYDSLPSPSTTNLIVSPGELSTQDMIKDMKEGIIIDQVIGSGQSNVLMGEFSVNLDLAFKVENGKIVGRIKNVMATGNIYELLKNILAVGKKAQFIGSICTPPFYFPRVHIAS